LWKAIVLSLTGLAEKQPVIGTSLFAGAEVPKTSHFAMERTSRSDSTIQNKRDKDPVSLFNRIIAPAKGDQSYHLESRIVCALLIYVLNLISTNSTKIRNWE
jgi:hypothetical protein